MTVQVGTASARTGDASRDQALPTADWFSAATFPTATFRSRAITATGPGRYMATGELAVRNVTRPIALPFTLAVSGRQATMDGSTEVDRSSFGVGQGQFKSGDTVGLKVKIVVHVVAHAVG